MSRRIAWLALPIALAGVLLAVVDGPAAVAGNSRAEAVLARLPFSAAERAKILAGELFTTSSRESTSNRELAITMAFLIHDPPPDLVALFQQASNYTSTKPPTPYGELHGDGSLAELQALRLAPGGDAEARLYAAAKPGDDLNLSSAELAAFAALPEKTTAAGEAGVRKLLLARYQAYRARGLAGIAPYDRGAGKETSPGEWLEKATRASPIVNAEAPEFVTALLDYPKSQPPQASESFFWVNFDIDGR